MSGLVSHGRELRPNQRFKLTEPAVDDFAHPSFSTFALTGHLWTLMRSYYMRILIDYSDKIQL
jgi:hypothetical protein